MSRTRRLVYENLRTVDSSTLSGSYVVIGAALANPSSILKMVNNSDVDVTVSTDGVNDMDVCPAGSFWLYDVTSDSPMESGSIFISQGTQYYIKGSVGTGSVYLVSQYTPQA